MPGLFSFAELTAVGGELDRSARPSLLVGWPGPSASHYQLQAVVDKREFGQPRTDVKHQKWLKSATGMNIPDLGKLWAKGRETQRLQEAESQKNCRCSSGSTQS